jgi:hypothetical protein
MREEMRKVKKVKKVAAILGGVASVGAVAIGSVGLAGVGFPSGPAHAGPPGFSTSSTVFVCQGNHDEPDCKPANPNSNGTVEVSVTTSGPKGALKNSNTPPPVGSTAEQCGPGKKKCD